MYFYFHLCSTLLYYNPHLFSTYFSKKINATDFSTAFPCLVTKFINRLYRLYFLLLDDVDVDVLGDFGI